MVDLARSRDQKDALHVSRPTQLVASFESSSHPHEFELDS
jgi:hypothetical protein